MSDARERRGESQDVVRPHSYDGIEEYDNPLPGWWSWIFYATIAWSGIYVVALGLGYVSDYSSELATENAEVDGVVRAWEASHPKPKVDEATLKAALADPARAEAGAGVFTARCASCHGDKGQGLIGPNLTDAYWIHGGAPLDQHRIVVEGVLAKGMPAWGSLLKPDEVLDVLSYVATIQGSSPAGAKAPQGELYAAP